MYLSSSEQIDLNLNPIYISGTWHILCAIDCMESATVRHSTVCLYMHVGDGIRMDVGDWAYSYQESCRSIIVILYLYL